MRILMQIFTRARAGLIILVSVTLFAPAQDAPNGGTASNIIALEHAWVDGQARNDNGALNLIFDNALVYVEYGKLVTKGEYLLRVRTAKSSEQMVVLESMTVRVLGGTAIVVGTYRERGVKGGSTSIARWRFVDTWVKKEGNWKLVAAASAPLR
jgi:ketosteroid isomerase-like protein